MPVAVEMKDKVTIVTGANSGVGFEASQLLAGMGSKVVLVCRDRGRGESAMDRIRARVPSADLRLEVTDLAELGEVRVLAEALSADFPAIHLLVNNAGVYRAGLETTSDGFEKTMAVNHLSHFLLTNLLMPQLLAGRGRVINVSSEAHRRAKLAKGSLREGLHGQGRYSGMVAYSDSKLANILFTQELAERFPAHELSTCAVHPGVLATRIWNQNRNLLSRLLVLLKPIMGKPMVGGDAVSFLAQEPSAAIHGRYFDKKREVRPAPPAQDEALARELWELSAELTGLPGE